jgi:hypothetical protein
MQSIDQTQGGCPMNSKARRFWGRLPGSLKEILTGLPSPASIESYEAIGRSWRALIECSGRRFEFASEERSFDYISVSEIIVAGSRDVFRAICPPADQIFQITPAQVCELMRQELSEPTPRSS